MLVVTFDVDRKILIIGDLHLGVTGRFGLTNPAPEQEADEILNDVAGVVTKMKIDEILVLGDLKHGLYEPTVYESKALRRLTDGLVRYANVWIAKGNHDFGIEPYLNSRVMMVGGSGLEINNTLLFHGHSLPRNRESFDGYSCIVSGHIHPQQLIRGEWNPVWLILKNKSNKNPKKVVVLPHYSKYISGVGYRPGPPITIAPYLKRLRLDEYRYEFMDLELNVIKLGDANGVVVLKNE